MNTSSHSIDRTQAEQAQRSVVALLEAPRVAGGLECLRSLQMSFEVVFLTQDILDYAKFDPECLLGHVKPGNVIEVDTGELLDVVGAMQEWSAENGRPIEAIVTHTREHLDVCNQAAQFMGLWNPNMPVDAVEAGAPRLSSLPVDPWADHALHVNVLSVGGEHELIAITGPRSKEAPSLSEGELNLLCMGLARTALDAWEHSEGPSSVQVVFTSMGAAGGTDAPEGAGLPAATVVGVSLCFSDDLGQEAGTWRSSPDPFERAVAIALGRPEEAMLQSGAQNTECLRLPARGFVPFGKSAR